MERIYMLSMQHNGSSQNKTHSYNQSLNQEKRASSASQKSPDAPSVTNHTTVIVILTSRRNK